MINTYMPTEGMDSDADYFSLRDEVFELVQKYSSDAKVLWVGDMNASPRPHKRHTKNDKIVHELLQRNQPHHLQKSTRGTHLPSF